MVLMSEFETHPLSIIEALELGRPALVADTSGLREIARHGLATPVPLESTSEDLARAIIAELGKPRPEPRIAPGTWEECARQLLNVYRDVLETLPGGATAASPSPAQEK